MKEKKQNEELQSRREFFKQATKKALPLVAVLVAPQIMSSCEKDLWKESEPTCRTCGGTCKNTCKEACSSDCELTCKNGCDTGCKDTCKSTCKGSCRYNSKY